MLLDFHSCKRQKGLSTPETMQKANSRPQDSIADLIKTEENSLSPFHLFVGAS